MNIVDPDEPGALALQKFDHLEICNAVGLAGDWPALLPQQCQVDLK